MSDTRKITIYSTRGGKKILETNVSTWGELKNMISEHYDLSNLKATENINKTTLERDDSLLPNESFVLFLRPTETKAGIDLESMSYQELRDILTDDTKEFIFMKTKKNWTNVGTKDLQKYIEEYILEHDDSEYDNKEKKYVIPDSAKRLLTTILADIKEIAEEYEENISILESIFNDLSKFEELLGKVESKKEDVDLIESYEDFMKGFNN